MCVKDAEQVDEEMENLGLGGQEDTKPWPPQPTLLNTQIEDYKNDSPVISSANRLNMGNSSTLESISEDATVVLDRKQNQLTNFVPSLRSGDWSDIGGRTYMEDTHICIADIAKNFGFNILNEEAVSFYGVFDGHGGKAAAHFVRDHLPRVIVEDADFPLEMEKVVTRSFVKTDSAFAKSCSLESGLSSGTTALTAMIFGRIIPPFLQDKTTEESTRK